jgi:3-oxoadipate enol-lactonase/4-carboxymuconolactone decarboxylase
MPFAINDGCRLYWRQDGVPDRPALLLLNDVGADMGLWERVLPLLSERFCVIRMDMRGQGASDAPAGPYPAETLADDALTVLDAAGADVAFVCGVGLGSLIGLALGSQAPARVVGLVLGGLHGVVEPRVWARRGEAVLSGGMAAVANDILAESFSAPFAATHPQIVATAKAALLASPVQGYAAACAAIGDKTAREPARIAAPTLAIDGRRDPAAPAAEAAAHILAGIPGVRRMALDAGRLACLEAPAAFAGAVISFVDELEDGGAVHRARQTVYDAGMKVRRKVLGDAWVDRALANRTEFNADYQDMVTRYAWQEIWSRPGLDHPTRRLLVLAMTASLGRWEEFRLHVKLGLDQGELTVDQIKETLLQTAVYAGVPAANTGFAEAASVIKERDGKDNKRDQP